MKTNETTNEQQANDFLSGNGLKFRATLSDTKTPAWATDGGECGHHYRVTISRPSIPAWKAANQCGSSRLVFDFWGSVADAKKLEEAKRKLSDLRLQRQNQDQWSKGTFDLNFSDEMEAREQSVAACHPSTYDVLSCISSDAYAPETFKEFCLEYGYEPDSIKALQTFRRHSAFAKRLKAFFTASELEQLSEINSW